MSALKWIKYASIGACIVLVMFVMLSMADGEERLDKLLTVYHQDDNSNGINEGYFFRMDDSFLLVVRDSNEDGVLDEFEYYENGKVRARVADLNGDLRLDRWEVRKNDSGVYARDLDFDGIVDEQKKISYEELF